MMMLKLPDIITPQQILPSSNCPLWTIIDVLDDDHISPTIGLTVPLPDEIPSD